MIVNPLSLYKIGKMLFSQNVKTLGMTIKVFIVVILSLYTLDNLYGWSNTLLVNTRIDLLNHLYSSSSLPKDKSYADAFASLYDDIMNYKNMLEKTADDFCAYDEGDDNRIQLINTLTCAIIPIVIFFNLIYHLIVEIAVKRDGQLERVVDILILLACVVVLYRIMIALSYVIPTFPKEYVWGNYGFNLFCTLLLYLVMCNIMTRLSLFIRNEQEEQDNAAVPAADVIPGQGRQQGEAAPPAPEPE